MDSKYNRNQKVLNTKKIEKENHNIVIVILNGKNMK